MKVLVAGGAGYVGCRLVPELLSANHEVTVLDCCMFGVPWSRGEFSLIEKDIQRADARDLLGYDAVINLAGFSNDPTADLFPDLNKAINTAAAIRLAHLCVEAGVPRYVLASSCSVYYTDEPTDEIFTEESEIDPTAHYSRSKYEAEKGILALASSSFCPVVLRKGTIYGYSPRMRYDLVVQTMLKDAVVSRCIRINGGNQWRPLLDIRHAIRAYCLMLEAPTGIISGQVFNVLTLNVRVSQIAEWIKAFLQTKGYECAVERLEDALPKRSYRVSGDKYDYIFGKPVLFDNELWRIWRHLESGINPEDPEYHNIRWMQRTLCA